jgi:hypothetical protein
VDDLPQDFPLTIKGVESDFKKLINAFFIADRAWTIGMVSNVKHEKVLGPAFISMAESVLK